VTSHGAEGTGLTEQAAGTPARPPALDEARQRWETSMLAEIERIRDDLRRLDPLRTAANVAGHWREGTLRLKYWAKPIHIDGDELIPRDEGGEPLAAFDQAMVLYHLRQSDGLPLAGRWVSYRELPGGEFYHQAYQGYTGRRLAEAFGVSPEGFAAAAAQTGQRLNGPAPQSWSFAPFPRITLAACLWPGDDEVPSQASVLFDAHAGHHLPIDGLALLGAGVTGRLLREAKR
jgi:hypothetical protein